MARDRKLMKEHHLFVTEVYNQLSREGHNHREICKRLKKDYYQFITPRTIYAIVSGEYENQSMKE